MLAGIDVGSTGLKVALYTGAGSRLGYAYREYAIQYGPEGQATLNPALWWQSLSQCLEELSAAHDLQALQGIGISSANAMVLTDAGGTPVFPAIMQLDKRSTQTVSQVSQELGDGWIFQRTGNRNAPGYLWGATLKWLQLHEREAFSRVRRIFNPTSYLVFRLTGAYQMDHTRAATTLLYAPAEQCWDRALCHYFGLDGVVMPSLLASHQLSGHTRPTLLPGLPAGIPVAAGAMDTSCAMLGLMSGQPGDVLIMGSVGRFATAVSTLDHRFLNTVSWDGTQKISMTPVNNAGTALKWAKHLLFSTQDMDYDTMSQMAATIPPGSGGLLFLPFLNGASCPHWNENIRGTFLGLTAYHTTAHMIRAVMEGVALSLKENFLLLKACGGLQESTLYLGGGGANSSVWSQILCDTLNTPLSLPTQPETETMGAALLGGLAAGVFAPHQMGQWNQVKTVLMPDAGRVSQYARVHADFSRSYGLMEQLYAPMTPHAGDFSCSNP